MSTTTDYTLLKAHIRQEIEAASRFLELAATFGDMLENPADIEAITRVNEQTVARAQAMQALSDDRTTVLVRCGIEDLQTALSVDSELAQLEAQRLDLVRAAQEVNNQNSIVVTALMDQTQERMAALQRAARQTDVYTPKGQVQSQGSRTLASA